MRSFRFYRLSTHSRASKSKWSSWIELLAAFWNTNYSWKLTTFWSRWRTGRDTNVRGDPHVIALNLYHFQRWICSTSSSDIESHRNGATKQKRFNASGCVQGMSVKLLLAVSAAVIQIKPQLIHAYVVSFMELHWGKKGARARNACI